MIDAGNEHPERYMPRENPYKTSMTVDVGDKARNVTGRWSYGTVVAIAIGLLTVTRILCASFAPLASDEVLYWRYSQHLAPGYLDHPAVNPFLIRVGTTLFGDTPFGIRIAGALLGLPASWAIWRAGSILFEDNKIGATAALFFNVTVVSTVGLLVATSDQPAVAMSCILLFALAKVKETGRGVWWMLAGAAFGLGMFSKYTTLFLGPGVL